MRPVQIALLVCGVTCNAAIQYQFSYTAVNGPVKDFSFLVTAPGYLAAGTAPIFLRLLLPTAQIVGRLPVG